MPMATLCGSTANPSFYTLASALAHEGGLQSIEEEILECDWEKGRFVVRATVTTKSGVFVGHGDATKFNCGKMILPHALRMASTRAKARALRDATGLGITGNWLGYHCI
jgi:hypothetical protein